MGVASEHLVTAKGWDLYPKQKDENQSEYLDFAHKIAKTFSTIEGKEVLNAMVQKYLVRNIALPTDTQIGVGIKEGEARVVRYILNQIELSNNS